MLISCREANSSSSIFKFSETRCILRETKQKHNHDDHDQLLFKANTTGVHYRVHTFAPMLKAFSMSLEHASKLRCKSAVAVNCTAAIMHLMVAMFGTRDWRAK